MYSLEKNLIPKPKEILQNDQEIKIAAFAKSISISVSVDDERALEGKELIEKRIYELGAVACKNNSTDYNIVICVDPDNEKFTGVESDEAYYISVSEKESILCGAGAAGAFYAAVTFCDMMYKNCGFVYIPLATIKDYPDFKYRGHFIECRYGSELMTKQDWFDAIDYMAKTKINRFTIGVYGCWSQQYDEQWTENLLIPLEDYPKIKASKNVKYYSVLQNKWIYKKDVLPKMQTEDFLGEIIAYAKRKNIIVKPLFNSLGHNTLLPKCIPEIAAKDENGNSKGFGFCTKNEKTYEVMFDIYDNIIDKYLKPNGIAEIEIGLDEVMENYKCHCDICKDFEHSQLMVEYIIKLCKHLKARGMKRIHIYHDMLYHEFNIVNEQLRETFEKEGIYDEVVLDWWTYEDPEHLFWDKTEGVNNIFHSIIKPDTGYYHWVVPTENNENIRACVKLAKGLNFEGVEAYGSFEYCYDKNYLTLAETAWNATEAENEDDFNLRYALRYYPENVQKACDAFKSLSDIMKDETKEMYMNRLCYKFEYYHFSYNRPKLPYPQNYPGAAYKRIEDEEEVFVPYFKFLKEKAESALAFFENSGNSSEINDMWKLTAMHYAVDADEFLTLYGLHKTYNSGTCDEFKVLKELDRLILNREELMALAERVRIEATAHLYLRNMSIVRQYMLDLKKYFEKEIKAGRKPKLDMMDLSYIESEEFNFLR